MKVFFVVLLLVPFALSHHRPRASCDIARRNGLNKFSSDIKHNTHNIRFYPSGKNRDICLFYTLYTQKNKNVPHFLTNADHLEETQFDSKRPTMIATHGWAESSESETYYQIKDTALAYNDVNYIFVDWSKISLNKQEFARNKVKPVGEAIGDFITDIQKKYNIDGSSFLLVGHDLGAHVMGNAGAAAKNKVDRIIGLDPSGFEFESNSQDSLNPSNAYWVEVIHTDMGKLGFSYTSIGHADYFPNGGLAQPKCLNSFERCDHSISIEYFVESLKNGPKFEAVRCDSYETFLKQRCKNKVLSAMGGLIREERFAGDYYLETGKSPPYAIVDRENKNKTVSKKIADYKYNSGLITKLIDIFLKAAKKIIGISSEETF